MKIISFLITISLLISFNLKSQSPTQIVNYFKNKDIENAVNNCVFSFDLRAGCQYDDTIINNKEILKRILTQLFKDSYFDDMLKGKIIIDNSKEISFESRQFNEKGELESESALSFHFRKIKGKYKLYSIVLAG